MSIKMKHHFIICFILLPPPFALPPFIDIFKSHEQTKRYLDKTSIQRTRPTKIEIHLDMVIRYSIDLILTETYFIANSHTLAQV